MNVAIRKIVILSLVLVLLGVQIAEAKDSPAIHARSYILMDFASGAILKEVNGHLPLPPASMTKMMTGLLILDKIKSGELRWEESVPISLQASQVGHAHVDLKAGKPEILRDLFRAMWVRSANNATVALTEHVAGSEEHFVGQMNQKAKELGMVHTHYANSTGLEPSLYPSSSTSSKRFDTHVMSAYDAAILCRYIVKKHPETLSITSSPRVSLGNKRTYINWNEMLRGFRCYYPGVDGMKTGHTDDSGYCFTSTAKRGDYRLITVVMDTPSKLARFKETAKLLDDGFTKYTLQMLAKHRVNIKELPISRGVERTLPVGVKQPLQLAMVQGERNHYTVNVVPEKDLRAPVSQGEVVGKVTVLYKGKEIPGFVPVEAIANTTVEKENWFFLLFRGVGDFFSGLFS